MLRLAVSADVEPITALEQDVFGADAWGMQAVERELQGRAAVAESGTGLVGYVAVMVVGDVADLTRVAVRPSSRRTGIGSSLVNWAVESARSEGAGRILLEVAETNTGARALYVAAGFEELARRERYYAGGVDALVLARTL